MVRTSAGTSCHLTATLPDVAPASQLSVPKPANGSRATKNHEPLATATLPDSFPGRMRNHRQTNKKQDDLDDAGRIWNCRNEANPTDWLSLIHHISTHAMLAYNVKRGGAFCSRSLSALLGCVHSSPWVALSVRPFPTEGNYPPARRCKSGQRRSVHGNCRDESGAQTNGR